MLRRFLAVSAMLVSFIWVMSTFNTGYCLKVKLFSTYQSYQDNAGKEIGDLESFNRVESPVGNSFSLVIKGKSGKTKTDNIWGFSVDEYVFRMWNNLPYVIYSAGEFVYYERGDIQLHSLLGTDMLINRDETLRFYSKDLTSDVYSHKRIFKFKKVYPEFKEYFDCIYTDKKKAASFEHKREVARTCFKNLNGD
jgi:hypothetical protein